MFVLVSKKERKEVRKERREGNAARKERDFTYSLSFLIISDCAFAY